MLKNKDEHVKQLAEDYAKKYNANRFSVILFIRRLNNMGYVIVKSEDLQKFGMEEVEKNSNLVVPWLSFFDKKNKDALKE